jgi:hypothetical protein
MKYREEQRKKAIKIRDTIFKDPGNGIFFGKEREFVLEEPVLNLWEGLQSYFITPHISQYPGIPGIFLRKIFTTQCHKGHFGKVSVPLFAVE